MKRLSAALAVTCAALALTGCDSPNSDPKNTPIGAAETSALTADAQNVARGLATYRAENGDYPTVPGPQVPTTLGTPLSSGNTISVYQPPTFCLVNQATGAWILMDASTNTTTTTGPRCGLAEGS